MNPSKHQKSIQKCKDLCWNFCNCAESVAFGLKKNLNSTVCYLPWARLSLLVIYNFFSFYFELHNQHVFIGDFLNNCCVLCIVKAKKGTKTSKELCQVS